MGSSPVTATTPSPLLLEAADRFLARVRSEATPPNVLVAFSGGADSTALLWALSRRAPRVSIAIHAAHLDHGLDPDSGTRALAAVEIAASLGIALRVGTLLETPEAGESPEAWARRQRYLFLEAEADRLGVHHIATAHHADDQAETLVLRWLFGTGLGGLRGIRPRAGRVTRPLLGLRRHHLRAALETAGIRWIEDPTNRDEDQPRSRVRHRVLPRLSRRVPDLTERLTRLARSTQGAVDGLERWLTWHLELEVGIPETGRGTAPHEPSPSEHQPGASVRRSTYDLLPPEIRALALALWTREAGAEHPVSAAVARELDRQLAADGRVACDAGGGWRFSTGRGRIRFARAKPSPGRFTYTGSLPGSLAIPELGREIQCRPSDVESWMFQRHRNRVGLTGRLPRGTELVVRNRRAGDRIRPLGSTRERRLKELLIDRGIPRWHRDHLPLLVLDGTIAWVPGVTVDDRFRLQHDETSAWVVTIEDLEGGRP